MKLSVQSTVILLGVLFLLQVSAYPNGQVQDSCISMEPSHGVTAQTSTAPYSLTVSKSSYTSGEKLTVILSGTSGAQMKGFLIQARAGSSTIPLGSFQTSDSNSQTLTCTTAASSVSQKSNSKMSSVQMTWQAPSSNISDIQIRAAVVQSKSVFWVNVMSSKLTYAGTSTSTGSTGTSTSTGSTVSKTTTTRSMDANSSGCRLLVPTLGHLLLSSTLLTCSLLAL